MGLKTVAGREGETVLLGLALWCCRRAAVERLLKRRPLAVMARVTLRRALTAWWLDALFAQYAERHYVRSLLFSTVVELRASVTCGFRPSILAAVAGPRRNGRRFTPLLLTLLACPLI